MVLCRLYETVFITRVEAEQESLDKLHGRLLKAMDQAGGVELKLVNWGKRKLAFEIAGERKGNYYYFGYIAAPAVVTELQRLLRLSSDVLRFQTVRLSELQPMASFDVENERKRVEAITPEREEDEEEQYLRRARERSARPQH
jgi:small subunit ribosomal protein S6